MLSLNESNNINENITVSTSETELGSVQATQTIPPHQFNKTYSQLQKWTKDHKRLPTKSSDSVENKLYNWCNIQKANYSKQKLSMAQINKLNKLRKWSWDRHNDNFDSKLKQLSGWIKKNKRLPDLKNSDDDEEAKLAVWCNSLKSFKRSGKLAEEKSKKLEEIELWSWNSHDERFENKIKQMNKWVAENNRLPYIHSDSTKEESELGTWCCSMRHKLKKNKLSEEQKSSIEAIPGWTWTPDRKKNRTERQQKEETKQETKQDTQDETFVQKKRQYNRKQQTSDVESKKVSDLSSSFNLFFKDLVDNISNQVSNNLSLQIVKTVKQELNKNIDTNSETENTTISKWDTQFNDKYNELVKWIKKHDKLPVSSSYNSQERQLGVWCGARRVDKRQNRLADWKSDKLEQITQWFWNK